MGLLNSTPAFETTEHETVAGASAAVLAAANTAPAAVMPAVMPAVVPQATVPANAVAVASSTAVGAVIDQFALSVGMKNAIPVGYNTFPQITTTNGNFIDRETKLNCGDTIVFELLSHQDSWVLSPNEDSAAKELVRYSDDGVTCSDGTPVKEHLAFLQAGGYPKASLKQRAVVVGAVLSASKTSKYNGELVQFDLSPMSRSQWQRYLANSVYILSKGRKTKDQLLQIRAEAQLASNGANTYTMAVFSAAV